MPLLTTCHSLILPTGVISRRIRTLSVLATQLFHRFLHDIGILLAQLRLASVWPGCPKIDKGYRCVVWARNFSLCLYYERCRLREGVSLLADIRLDRQYRHGAHRRASPISTLRPRPSGQGKQWRCFSLRQCGTTSPSLGRSPNGRRRPLIRIFLGTLGRRCRRWRDSTFLDMLGFFRSNSLDLPRHEY